MKMGIWHLHFVLCVCTLLCCQATIRTAPSDGTLQPCAYNGTSLQHGARFAENKCVLCECYNASIRCDEMSCFQVFCYRPLSYDDECCDICPFDVPVYRVSVGGDSSLPAVKAGTANILKVVVDILVNDHGQPVQGSNLWKLALWASTELDGSGKKIGLEDQVLAENNLEASQPLYRFVPHGGLKISFQPEYNLDASNVSCKDLRYICASFGKNEAAITRHGIHIVPFNVYGVRGEHDSWLERGNLVGCRQIQECIDHQTEEVRPEFRRCFYNGTIINHGERLRADRCTTCACDNGTVRCDKQSCRPLRCSPEEPKYLNGECCSFCPFVVPVYEVAIGPVKDVKAGTINEMSFDLHLRVNEGGHWLIEGNGLWKVGVWASSNEDGSGNRIGFTEQVLTSSQASNSLLNFAPFTINGIYFHLNTSGSSCQDLRYLCASFHRGDFPELQYLSRVWVAGDVGFRVYGVENSNDYSPNPERLTTCRRFTSCADHHPDNTDLLLDDELPCSFRGDAIYHGETVKINSCMSCHCNNSLRLCSIKSCPPLFCKTPLRFEDECCDVCPFDVPVTGVTPSIVPSGTGTTIAVDVQVSVINLGQLVEGKDLWRVAMWTSGKADGSSNKIGYIEQVLSDDQASQTLDSPPLYAKIFQFTIPGISYQLNMADTVCVETRYLCASFNSGGLPEVTYRYTQSREFSPLDVKFDVYGIEPDYSFNTSRLTGCSLLRHCERGQNTSRDRKQDRLNHRIWQWRHKTLTRESERS